jgi:hypothetical protein
MLAWPLEDRGDVGPVFQCVGRRRRPASLWAQTLALCQNPFGELARLAPS